MTNQPSLPTAGTDERLDRCLKLWDSSIATTASGARASVVFHGDTDGLVSAVYIAATLRAVRNLSITFHCVHTEDYDFEPLRSWMASESPELCVCLDISLASHERTVRALSDSARTTFIFDHHQQRADLTLPPNVIVANPTPSLEALGNRPVPSFLFARAVATRQAIPFPAWLALVTTFCEGVDSFYVPDVARLFAEVFDTSPPANPRNAFRTSPASSFCNLIRAGFATANGDAMLWDLFSRVASEDPFSLASVYKELSDRFGATSRAIAGAISSSVEDWKSQLARDPGGQLSIIPLVSPFDIAGPVASILRGSFPDKVIVAYRLRRNICTLELRTRNDTTLNLAEILKRMATRLPIINAGGHPSAAGALIEQQHLPAFLEELRLSLLE